MPRGSHGQIDNPEVYGFLAFYLSCIFITWFFYTRRGGLLFDIERGRVRASAFSISPAR